MPETEPIKTLNERKGKQITELDGLYPSLCCLSDSYHQPAFVLSVLCLCMKR